MWKKYVSEKYWVNIVTKLKLLNDTRTRFLYICVCKHLKPAVNQQMKQELVGLFPFIVVSTLSLNQSHHPALEKKDTLLKVRFNLDKSHHYTLSLACSAL